MITADKAAIIVGANGVAQIMPGIPFARLTKKEVKALDFPVKEKWFRPNLGKYVYPVKHYRTEPLDVCAAFSLTVHNQTDIKIETASVLNKFLILVGNTYRHKFITQGDQRKVHLEQMGVLSRQIKVISVNHSHDLALIDKLTDRIEENFTQ